jgi:hypothetical protein
MGSGGTLAAFPSGARVNPVQRLSAEPCQDPIEAVACLAALIGAEAIARDARDLAKRLRSGTRSPLLCDQSLRRLCLRAELYLHERRRALDRTEPESDRHVQAILACVVLTHDLLEDRAAEPDPDRQLLAGYLALERTKFLMSIKAEVLSSLAARLRASGADRGRVREVARAIADELATESIVAWIEKLRPTVTRAMSAMAERLLREARASFGPLVDWVPALALLDVQLGPLPTSYRIHPVVDADPGLLARLGDRIRLAGALQLRVEQAAADHLMRSIELHSRLAIRHTLHQFDDTTTSLEASLMAMLDSLADGARVAAACARQVRSGGAHAVMDEHGQISVWLRKISEVMRDLG